MVRHPHTMNGRPRRHPHHHVSPYSAIPDASNWSISPPLKPMRLREDEGLQPVGMTLGATFGPKGVARRNRPHWGWDLQAAPNTTVYAVATGTIVAVAAVEHQDFGNYIKLAFRDPAGRLRYAFYAHLNAMYVRVGDVVMSGMPIGLSGGTGMHEAKVHPHLHFELHTEFGQTNPLKAGVLLATPTGRGRLDPGELLGYEVYSSTPRVSEPGD
jgi:murein DD-endopeptidase MepM/ murein hydrolase activator NlpD